MWTDPSGKRHDSIPPRWQADGHTVELAGDPRRARRAGWAETATAVPTVQDQAAAEAKRILADPDAADAVRCVLARVAAVAKLGVDISDWSFQGVTEAAERAGAKAEFPTRLDILTAAMALRTAWDRIVYHVGDMRRADELWPALYEVAVKQP